MKNLKKLLQTSYIEGHNWKQDLGNYLRNYRATPHTYTKISPHKALFGRDPQIKLAIPTPNALQESNEFRHNDTQARTRMQDHANR